jgi:hypothetical protein
VTRRLEGSRLRLPGRWKQRPSSVAHSATPELSTSCPFEPVHCSQIGKPTALMASPNSTLIGVPLEFPQFCGMPSPARLGGVWCRTCRTTGRRRYPQRPYPGKFLASACHCQPAFCPWKEYLRRQFSFCDNADSHLQLSDIFAKHQV